MICGEALHALLPHRPPILMIQRVVAISADEIVAEGAVSGDCALVEGDAVPGFIAIEMAAQAAAILETIGRTGRSGAGSAPQGYLVGVRGVRLRKEFPPGRACRLLVRREAFAPPLAVFQIEVSDEEGEIARGQLSAFIAEKP